MNQPEQVQNGGNPSAREALRSEDRTNASRDGAAAPATAGDRTNETSGVQRVAGAAAPETARQSTQRSEADIAARVAALEAEVRAAVALDPIGDARVEAAARASSKAPANDLDMQGLIYSISKPLDVIEPSAEADARAEAARDAAAQAAAEAAAQDASRFEAGLTIVRGEA